MEDWNTSQSGCFQRSGRLYMISVHLYGCRIVSSALSLFLLTARFYTPDYSLSWRSLRVCPASRRSRWDTPKWMVIWRPNINWVSRKDALLLILFFFFFFNVIHPGMFLGDLLWLLIFEMFTLWKSDAHVSEVRAGEDGLIGRLH